MKLEFNTVEVLKAFHSIIDSGKETALRGEGGSKQSNAERLADLKRIQHIWTLDTLTTQEWLQKLTL